MHIQCNIKVCLCKHHRNDKKPLLKCILIHFIAVLVTCNLCIRTCKTFQASGNCYKSVYFAFPSVLQTDLVSDCSQILRSD